MLELNFANMMEDTIGRKGLSIQQIESMRDKIGETHRKIKNMSWHELAFLELSKQDKSEIKRLAHNVREDSDYLLLLGIGGSAMGPRSILNALSPLHNLRNHPHILIYDNADPDTLNAILSVIDLKRTTVNLISKSGSTAETIASFMILWDQMEKALGKEAKKRIIATTDIEKGSVRKIVNDYGIRSLPIPSDIVGRYSVLSQAGLFTAEVAGIDSNELLRGADDILEKCSNEEVWENPSYLFASLLHLMNRDAGKNITVMMPYASGLKSLSEWFCQLWAESLGKLGFGSTPYPSIGTTDQHSQLQLWMDGPDDKVVIFIRIDDYKTDIRIPDVFRDVEDFRYLSGHTMSGLIKAEQESTELVLAKEGRPNMTIILPKIDAYYIGQLFQFLELSTAFTGFLLGVNPFNQPWIEYSKNLTYGMMGKPDFEKEREMVEIARERKLCWKI